MAFNISGFKTEVGEFLRPFAYTVNIKPPGATTDLVLKTESISLPGVSFAEVDAYKPFGNGLTLSIPHSSTVQEITCVHTVDSQGEVLQTFYNWANKIIDLSGENKFSAYYYDDYVAKQSNILVYDVKGSIVKRYTLYNMYPSSYDQLEMSWDSGGEIARLSVTYKFEYFKITN